MKKIIKKKSFSEIINFYDFFFFDLYGVTHNGIKLFEKREKDWNSKNHTRRSIKDRIKKYLQELAQKYIQ